MSGMQYGFIHNISHKEAFCYYLETCLFVDTAVTNKLMLTYVRLAVCFSQRVCVFLVK